MIVLFKLVVFNIVELNLFKRLFFWIVCFGLMIILKFCFFNDIVLILMWINNLILLLVVNL